MTKRLRQRRKKQVFSYRLFTITLFIASVVSVYFMFAPSDVHGRNNINITKSIHPLITQKPLVHVLPLSTPSPSPTPKIPSPTLQAPTSIPSGFCVHAPILLYHHTEPLSEATLEGHAQLTVDASIFDSQMVYLKNTGYNVVSIDTIVNAILNHQTLPEKSIAVTLDDGYKDAFTYAYPISQKYSLAMNYMIPTGLIDNPGYMSWENLKEITANSLTHLYNHTWSHAGLGVIPPEQIDREITLPKQQLADALGVHTDTFIYPYGSFSDYAIAKVKQNGYRAGVSTLPGSLQCESFIMTLHRTHIGNAPLSAYGF